MTPKNHGMVPHLESGPFGETSPETEPLLHTWSLAADIDGLRALAVLSVVISPDRRTSFP